MADKKVKLMNQAGDELYPRTTVDNILSAPGSTAYASIVVLNSLGKIDATYLPSYVDDVIELLVMSSVAPATCAAGDLYYNTVSKKIFTATDTDTWGTDGADPDKGVIYVNLENDKLYRWAGTSMAEISQQVSTVTSVGPATGTGAATDSEVPTALAVRSAITDAAYTLPAAGSAGIATGLGGIYVGDNLTVTGGTVSIPDGSTGTKGAVQLATVTEATSGTLETKAVTPLGLKSVADTKQPLLSTTTNITVSGNSISVATATSNTKGVAAFDTAESNGVSLSVNAGTVSITGKTASTSQNGTVALATTAEASSGTNTTKAVTPAGLNAAMISCVFYEPLT